MSNVIALALFVLLAAIPVAAVLAAYRDLLEPTGTAARRLLAFDPRHPGLAYDASDHRVDHLR